MGLSILSLVLAGAAWGQTGPRDGPGGGPSGLYDPQTVATVSGVVVSLTPPQAEAGLPYLAYLTLRTETGKIKVFLGPSLYVDKLPVQINVLDKIQVTGSKITWEGKPVILAAEVKKGDQVLKLRETNGTPVGAAAAGTKGLSPCRPAFAGGRHRPYGFAVLHGCPASPIVPSIPQRWTDG